MAIEFSKSNLLWIDLEMTGLDPYIDTILEVAAIVTNNELEILDEGFNMVIHQSADVLNTMDEWNTTNHTKTGLYKRALESPYSMYEIEMKLLDYVKQFIPEKVSPLCGNTIWQDRMFLINYMPKFNSYVHYRNIDVSTIKELSYKWYPDVPRYKKEAKHSALHDIHESISELQHYRKTFFKLPTQI